MPSRIGRYVVRRRIGNGGFATVWLAYDEQLDAPVAIKVLADNWTEDHQVRTRFVEEGRFLRRVESPHVVTVYDAGELDDGRPYLVMSYADQGTLADRLEVEGVSVRQALEVVRQVGAGLQALHDRGVLHRDIKPANVLFRTVPTDGGASATSVRAMVGDLGLGKALDVSSRLTMIAGTPSFVAPEQAQGEAPDGRADQYSLGVLTYLLLTGRTPWTHASLGAAADPAPPPPLSTPERPYAAGVEAVLARALSRDRDQRWPSVTAYVAALGAALADADADGWRPDDAGATTWLPLRPDLTQPGARPSPVPVASALPDPVPPAPRRRRPVLLAGVGLLAVAVGATVGWFSVGTIDRDVTVTDSRSTVSVTVPAGWDDVAREPWTPPGQDGGQDARFAALSAGTDTDWRTAPDGEGVFLGVLPLDELPRVLPDHDCGQRESPITDTSAEPTRTVYATDCPGVTVDRVVQVADNRVLWVQVRSTSRSRANAVLSSVDVDGL